ncbi:MAG: hypothetical protein U0984_04540 [Prosthecobacter sp.]|nr:hypothetical protein [Prosthecobacter sp.]
MKYSDDLMLIPHEEGFRAWRVKGTQVAQVDAESRSRRGTNWIALPARGTVSIPMRFQGVDQARREAAVQLELEAAGFTNETAHPQNFEVYSLGTDERDQRTAAFVQMAGLPPAILEEGNDAKFAPSVAFRTLHPGEVLIWREGGNLVMAVPHESGQPIHCQALAARVLDADAAAEVRCVLASLELSGLLPTLQSLCVVAADETEEVIPVSFENALDLPVTLRKDEPPVLPTQPARMVPPPVVQLRHERQQRRMVLMGAMAFAFVIVAALAAFGARVGLREKAIADEEKALDAQEAQLMSIRDARAAWEDLNSAITPDRYPVEAFYQLVLLLPEENIRLTRFEVREDGMVLDGEASSLNHAIEFRERLVAAPAFTRWTWDFPQPTNLPDGRATFRAEARPGDPLAANTTAEVPTP